MADHVLREALVAHVRARGVDRCFDLGNYNGLPRARQPCGTGLAHNAKMMLLLTNNMPHLEATYKQCVRVFEHILAQFPRARDSRGGGKKWRAEHLAERLITLLCHVRLFVRDEACRARVLASIDEHEMLALQTLALSVDTTKLQSAANSPAPSSCASPRVAEPLSDWQEMLLNESVLALQDSESRTERCKEFAQSCSPIPPRKSHIKAYQAKMKEEHHEEISTPKGKHKHVKHEHHEEISTPKGKHKHHDDATKAADTPAEKPSKRTPCLKKPHDTYKYIKMHVCSHKSYLTASDGACFGKPGKPVLLVASEKTDHAQMIKQLFNWAGPKTTKESLCAQRALASIP